MHLPADDRGFGHRVLWLVAAARGGDSRQGHEGRLAREGSQRPQGGILGEEAPQRRPSPGVVIEEPQAPARPRPAPATQDLGGDKIDG